MTEESMADTQQEGAITFNDSVDEDNTSTDSPSENNDTEDTQSPDGDDENSQDDTDDDDDNAGDGDTVDEKTPFHKHPRWLEREEEWETRFNNQESRHQDNVKTLRDEFSKKPPAETKSKPIPSWFGGDQASWEAYQTDRESELKAAEEKAFERFNGTKTAEQKAVEEATTYMKDEIVKIEKDKELNPEGKKVNQSKLLKVVIDNELVDSKGRWNYRAGMKILQGQVTKPVSSSNTAEKKKIAGATTSESKGETKPKNFKTTNDFKQNRPW